MPLCVKRSTLANGCGTADGALPADSISLQLSARCTDRALVRDLGGCWHAETVARWWRDLGGSRVYRRCRGCAGFRQRNAVRCAGGPRSEWDLADLHLHHGGRGHLRCSGCGWNALRGCGRRRWRERRPLSAAFNVGGAGGAGAVVSAPSVAVGGTRQLYVEVGASGMAGGFDGTRCDAGPGGAGGGGNGGQANCAGAGGGGGGASDVRTQPALAGGLTAAAGDPRLVVAGGGGGGGGAGGGNGSDGGASGGSSIGGAGAGGTAGCGGAAQQGGVGQTGAGGGSGGVAPSACMFPSAPGAPGTPGQGGGGANGNPASGGGGGGYVGGGAGSAALPSAGGGGGSSFGPAGTMFAAAASAQQPSVAISWTAAPPSVTVTSPVAGASFAQGQATSTSFACSDGAGGTGIATCVDQSGAGSGATLDTAALGSHTLTVTATSSDGQTFQASVSYTVSAVPAASPPTDVAAVAPTPSSVSVPAGGIDPFLINERALPVRVVCAGGQTSCQITVTATVRLPGSLTQVTLPSSTTTLGAERWTTLKVRDPAAKRARIRNYLRHHRNTKLRVTVTITSTDSTAGTDPLAYTLRLQTLPDFR